MMRAFASLGLITIYSGLAFGQSADTHPVFDVADVHSVKGGQNPFVRGGLGRGGRYELRTATMVDLIAAAYGVRPENVFGGPSWLEWDRFDVIARAPRGASPDSIKVMLQALLADRFKLVSHSDTKPIPAYALTVGKGGRPRLKEASGTGEPGCQGKPRPQNLPAGTIAPIEVACHNMTMERFAEEVGQMAGGYLSDPVVDSTGLKGAWDFDLKWHGRGQLAAAGSDGISIFDAVDKQLGLKLDPQKIPAPVIFVDSVNQKPTPNSPEVAKSLPPPLAEFEVADVKPSAPGTTNQRGGFQPGGRLDLQNFPLKMMIQIAWDINNEELLQAPKWMDSERFDVVAKASSVALTNGPSGGPNIDFDTLRLMLRNLLIQRFKVEVHTEDRPVNAYTLTALKPKLTKADPASRMNFKEGPAAAAKDVRLTNPALSRLVTCQNITMAQFAELLPIMASGYIHTQVLDATGLEGGWDFSLNFSPIGYFRNAGGGRDGAAAAPSPAADLPSASDQGGLTLFEAMEKQLGLKLTMSKRPVPVLVVDHAEQKPIDN